MSRKNKRAAGWQARDPGHAREQRQYANPVPSRQLLTNDVAANARRYSREQLVESYALDDESAFDALDHRVRAMLRDGELAEDGRGRLLVPAEGETVRGRVQAHAKGFGFVIPDDADADDVFLSPRQMESIMDGDRVEVAVLRSGQRCEGRLLHILERANDTIVGRLIKERGRWKVVPHRSALNQPIHVAAGDTNGAGHDSLVSVRITQPPDKRRDAAGEVAEIIGSHFAPGAEIELALRAHEIPHVFPDDVNDTASQHGDAVREADKAGRVDLRDTPLVTIDGADAKDFDDAVYARATRNGWKLLVAIADVSHYVEPGSALDAEAEKRATSVYFPEHVVPMLPESLSNGLCSLVPDADRLALVSELTIDRSGRTRSSRFYSAVIRSHARLTYAQVADWYDNPENRPERHAHLDKPLAALRDVYTALDGARTERGAIAFETTAVQFVFDGQRKIERIVPSERNVAHKIIEECMIAANVAAATFLTKKRLPTLYRVHDAPAADALADLREFLSARGLDLPHDDKLDAASFNRVLGIARQRNDANLIQTVMLQSLARAFYTPDNNGHFGLALDQYAHFTSPIRRYPDLLVHRGIKHLLADGRARGFAYDGSAMERLGDQCSSAERRADEATREVEEWLKCEYMQSAVGDVFAGTITGVTRFGLFVELDGILVSGLVHITQLDDDFYEFDEQSRRLCGKQSGRRYNLGDPMRVQVARVDLDERKIDLVPVANTNAGRRNRKSHKRDKAL